MSDLVQSGGDDTTLDEIVESITVFCIREDQINTYLYYIFGLWILSLVLLGLSTWIRRKRVKLKNGYVATGIEKEDAIVEAKRQIKKAWKRLKRKGKKKTP